MYLKFLGYEVDRSDAYFSKQSGEALKQFQKDHGMKADGNIDSEVIDVLLSTISEEWNTNLEKNDVQMKKSDRTCKVNIKYDMKGFPVEDRKNRKSFSFYIIWKN